MVTEDTKPEAFTIDPSDIPNDGPSDLRDTEKSPNRCNYAGCVNPVLRTGKGGRPPKYCPEHKDKRPPKVSNSRSQTSGKSWSRASEIEGVLNRYIEGAGWTIQLVNPVDGKVIADNGPAVIHEIVELAKDDARLRKPLEALATPGKYGPLGIAVLAVVMPIMANHGLLPQFQISGLVEGGE